MLFIHPPEPTALPLAIPIHNNVPAGCKRRSASPPDGSAGAIVQSWQLIYRLAYEELVRPAPRSVFERTLVPARN
jgi:hypothetical protein